MNSEHTRRPHLLVEKMHSISCLISATLINSAGKGHLKICFKLQFNRIKWILKDEPLDLMNETSRLQSRSDWLERSKLHIHLAGLPLELCAVKGKNREPYNCFIYVCQFKNIIFSVPPRVRCFDFLWMRIARAANAFVEFHTFSVFFIPFSHPLFPSPSRAVAGQDA